MTGHPMPEFRWVSRARLHRPGDGDTGYFEVDQKFRTRGVISLRLRGVNCYETNRGTPEERERGRLAAEFTERWLKAAPGWDEHLRSGVRLRGGWVYLIETELVQEEIERKSFDRYLGRVWRVADGRCLNDDLIAAGHHREVQ